MTTFLYYCIITLHKEYGKGGIMKQVEVIKAKATLDVDYCVSDQLFADIGSSRDFFATNPISSLAFVGSE